MLEAFTLLEPTLMDPFPLLKSCLVRFETLPAIEEYVKCDEFIHWPFAPWVRLSHLTMCTSSSIYPQW